MKKAALWLACLALGATAWAGPEEMLKNESNRFIGESAHVQGLMCVSAPPTAAPPAVGQEHALAVPTPVQDKGTVETIVVPNPAPDANSQRHQKILRAKAAAGAAAEATGIMVSIVVDGLLAAALATAGFIGAAKRYHATRPGFRGRVQGFVNGTAIAFALPLLLGAEATRRFHDRFLRKNA